MGFVLLARRFPVQLLHTRDDLLAWRREQSGAVQFVPTMGALHAGHQQLIRRAAEPWAGAVPPVLVSVFVNPLPFGPGQDLDTYPRDLSADCGPAPYHPLTLPTKCKRAYPDDTRC